MGMILLIVAESMVFAGFISAFMIVRAQSLGAWPPADQPRLPVEDTMFNTAALLLSAVVLGIAQQRFRKEPARAKAPLAAAIGLGSFFVLFQGMEWAALLGEGLTLPIRPCRRNIVNFSCLARWFDQ